jgi:predicted SnoaL-like aldol condensation-catalyzing enzyme
MYQRYLLGYVLAVLLLCCAPGVSLAQPAYFAQPPTTPQVAPMTPAQQKNVDFILNWWREVIEAKHTELAPNYQAEDYIQHNPNVPTGRAAFVKFFSSLGPPTNPIPAKLLRPPVVEGAKDSLVWLIFQEEGRDPHDPLKRLYAPSFDLIRMENGKVQEHWDSAKKRPGSPAFVPSTAAAASTWITSKPTADEERNLAAATRLVKDVYQYGHVELLDSIVAPDFIQHNPTVPAGREGLDAFIRRKPELAAQPIQAEWKHAPVLQFVNGPYVVMMWEHKDADPSDATRQYTRNSFEVLRMENGLVKEDWNLREDWK